MSDEETTEEKKKRSDYERANAKGDVSPSDERVFEFLDSLFVDDKNFPESIDVRQVKGRDFDKMGEPVRKYTFSSGLKPSRERLVAIANEMVQRIRMDCDIRARDTMYHIAARNPQISSEFYDRILYRAKAGKAWKGRGEELGIENGGDDDDLSFSARYSLQMMGHHTQFISLVGGMLEGLIDRSDRQAAAAQANADRAYARAIELLESNMRLVAADDERKERAEDRKMWRDNIGKGLDMAWGLVPPLLSSFRGNGAWKQGEESGESYSLREYFKSKDAGGKLTPAEFETIFGKIEEGKVLKEGILSPEQGQLLGLVANKDLNPDELDHLLPGGRLELRAEQFAQVMKSGISLEVFMPLKALLEARLHRRQQRLNGKGE